METAWSDINSNIVKDARGDIALAYDVDAIMSSIDNILRTTPGERCMLRSFGCNITSLLFEPIHSSLLAIICKQIKDTIERWEPRVIINAVNYYGKPDSNEVYFTVSFAVKGYQETFKYVPPFKAIVND